MNLHELDPADGHLEWYAVEVGQHNAMHAPLVSLLDSDVVQIVNLPLAALLIPHLPSASPWLHAKVAIALAIQQYLAILQGVLKERSFLIIVPEQDMKDLLENRCLTFGPIRIQVSWEELLQALERLKSISPS